MIDDRDIETEVRWSAKGRALFALFVPFCAWLSWYAFTSQTAPSPGVGYLAIAGTIGAIVFQVHLAIYRVRTSAAGIIETSLRGTRCVPWRDVRKVELVAQARDGNRIQRWASSPEDAFHIIVHTQQGRIAVHRWMSNVDGFIASLDRSRPAHYRDGGTPVAAREDPSVKSVLEPSPLNAVVNQASEGLALVQAMVISVPLSLLLGLLGVIWTNLSITGSLLIDAALVALVPWGMALAGYKWIERLRRARFGSERARPPIGVRDFVLSTAAAMAGPVLLVGFIPRALGPSREAVDVVLVAVGVLMCWAPIDTVRKTLRR
jgi:hypothetical protein